MPKSRWVQEPDQWTYKRGNRVLGFVVSVDGDYFVHVVHVYGVTIKRATLKTAKELIASTVKILGI